MIRNLSVCQDNIMDENCYGCEGHEPHAYSPIACHDKSCGRTSDCVMILCECDEEGNYLHTIDGGE